jgi:hypothetical protein
MTDVNSWREQKQQLDDDQMACCTNQMIMKPIQWQQHLPATQ